MLKVKSVIENDIMTNRTSEARFCGCGKECKKCLIIDVAYQAIITRF